ncbi:Enolase-phosphatase E1 [Diplonema papillatum]|nr:Enolase-phosphatase E1 [Diplonema papillatum]
MENAKSWEATRHLLSALTSRCFAAGCDRQSQMALNARVAAMAEGLLKEVTPAQVASLAAGTRAVVTDIEGTTTPIPFVSTVLFPYSDARFEEYVRKHYSSLSAIITTLRAQAVADRAANPPVAAPPIREEGTDAEIIADVVANLLYNSKANRKVTPLKELQGMIWKEGYASGALVSQIYEDVPRAFRRWKAQGRRVYIYSSGSVAAQKLLFSGGSEGSLLGSIDGHFDTTTGHKQEVASYAAIAKEIGEKPADVLFLTDIVGEAVAARSAGMTAMLLLRPDNNLFSPDDQPAAASFLQLLDFDDLFPVDNSEPETKKQRTV